MSIMAFSLGFGMAQRTNLVAVVVRHEEIGEASAVLALVRNISGAFGVAIFSTLSIIPSTGTCFRSPGRAS